VEAGTLDFVIDISEGGCRRRLTCCDVGGGRCPRVGGIGHVFIIYLSMFVTRYLQEVMFNLHPIQIQNLRVSRKFTEPKL
jgi:hypothetical protein